MRDDLGSDILVSPLVRFYEVAQYGSRMTCVVLLDGSVLEPEGAHHTGRLDDYLE
jgi:hypothetical protein